MDYTQSTSTAATDDSTGVVLHEVEQNAELHHLVDQLLRGRLTKPRDRELFNLDKTAQAGALSEQAPGN